MVVTSSQFKSDSKTHTHTSMPLPSCVCTQCFFMGQSAGTYIFPFVIILLNSAKCFSFLDPYFLILCLLSFLVCL